MFYSISNCQRGLAGVSFGTFLIKQVVQEICRENPKLQTFVTLSPVPDFARWLDRERKTENSAALSTEDREALTVLDRPGWWQLAEMREPLKEPLLRAAAWYFLRATQPARLPGRCGGALPSRQRRTARAAQLARRRQRAAASTSRTG